jgi:ABC-type transport system involved in Fe-S cluster assembly fused permease/ATPase subunit
MPIQTHSIFLSPFPWNLGQWTEQLQICNKKFILKNLHANTDKEFFTLKNIFAYVFNKPAKTYLKNEKNKQISFKFLNFFTIEISSNIISAESAVNIFSYTSNISLQPFLADFAFN